MAETQLKAGDMAPDFELMSDTGEPVRLSDFRGKRVVIYFYPKDDTPGCTAQSCGFRDNYLQIEEKNATVLGISKDGVQSHQKFKTKYNLPFVLLADEDHAVAEAYGVWAEKSMYGRTYWGVERTTFVIDAAGRVAFVFERVQPVTHAKDVEAVLARL